MKGSGRYLAQHLLGYGYLLLAFFVLMFAFSEVDTGSFSPSSTLQRG